MQKQPYHTASVVRMLLGGRFVLFTQASTGCQWANRRQVGSDEDGKEKQGNPGGNLELGAGGHGDHFIQCDDNHMAAT